MSSTSSAKGIVLSTVVTVRVNAGVSLVGDVGVVRANVGAAVGLGAGASQTSSTGSAVSTVGTVDSTSSSGARRSSIGTVDSIGVNTGVKLVGKTRVVGSGASVSRGSTSGSTSSASSTSTSVVGTRVSGTVICISQYRCCLEVMKRERTYRGHCQHGGQACWPGWTSEGHGWRTESTPWSPCSCRSRPLQPYERNP